MLRLEILQILFEYNRVCEVCQLRAGRAASRQSQLVAEFKQLVSNHFRAQKQVRAYAEQLGITAKHLNECVRNELGHSALVVIHDRLVAEAKYRLENTGDSVKQIALDLRFDNPSHFSRFFKNKLNLTPSAYRQDYFRGSE